MADILVYNALKEASESLSISNGLAVTDINELKTTIEQTIDNHGNYAPLQKMTLNKLSCNQLIAHCNTQFCGSGSGTVYTNSPWQCELSATIPTDSDKFYTRIINTPSMVVVKNEMEDLNSAVLRNNIKQFIETYARAYIAKSPDSVMLLDYWENGSTYSSSIKVCSSSFGVGVGANCTWTVPNGVGLAKFQVWGAGAGTNPGCCCGGSPWGGNGAYSELVMQVNEGDQYVLCAGCSCSVFYCSNNCGGAACMSGVTGPGICCLKADGAFNNPCTTMHSVRCNVGAGASCSRFQNIYCTNSGPCWCTYGSYCFSNSCGTCGFVAVHADCGTGRTYCSCASTDTEIFKDGIRPIHGGGCLDGNHYGRMIRPPVLDSSTCKLFTSGCQCATFTSENCTGGCLATSWTKHPGMGGTYTHTMGGFNTHKGDAGTGGMVKVSWS